MKKVISITGTRADYGLMRPIYKAIVSSKVLELELIITGMHLLPEFQSSLEEIQSDKYCTAHKAGMNLGEDSAKAMAQSLGLAIFSIASIMEAVNPDILLLQGDRGEMLAGAISAAHMNIPIVHMSGGDYSGSIDDSIRGAISKFAHFHLTTCAQSSERLLSMGEAANRIRQVGEPGLDLIKRMKFISADKLAKEFNLNLSKPLILATQHPVTTELKDAGWQIKQTLEALSELNLQTVFTYPNTDTGGREMIKVLESYRNKNWIQIAANLGSEKYLSLMKVVSAVVGNSSSGILEAPSFKVPAVNVGTRQYGRMRASNVIDVDYDKKLIKKAIIYALEDKDFKRTLNDCENPYGDGETAKKTVKILSQLKTTPGFLTKWEPSADDFMPRV